jgi:hypothetical protein
MNERIQELIKQATRILPSDWNVPYNMEEFDKEKFVELIVNECVGIVEGGRFLHDEAPAAIFARECSTAIKRHFGVE